VHAAVRVVSLVNVALFVALAAVAVWQWRTRRNHTAAWAAAAFLALGFEVIAGTVDSDPHALGAKVLQRFVLVALVVFPYLLFRFTLAFRRPSLRLYRFVGSVTTVLAVWTFALPHVPRSGESWPAVFTAYVVVFFVHWTVLSIAASRQLWIAQRRQPTVARRRMQMLAFAAASITIALVLAALGGSASPLALAAQVLGLASGLAFFLGLAPPRFVRVSWRRPEQERLQHTIQELMALATSQEEIAARVLEPAAQIVGAAAVAVRNEDGRTVGAWATPDPHTDPLVLDFHGGSLLVWTSAYAPFFGSEEIELLRTLGALTAVALDRVRLFEQEHAARLELERANQLQANFVALAAHELRTPVTTIHGFVRTLNHLGERLAGEQRTQLRAALEQQTTRMALLVEQLLDLSRLDAEAVEIVPLRLRLRERVEEIVRSSAGEQSAAVRVEVPHDLEAEVDPDAFERILSNLITNAFRYGAPPVVVTAERNDRHLRVAVEDRGRGVPPEFVPELFERFSRSGRSHTAAGGTGLGLAIARSYAIAHCGDLRYEPVFPVGARFQLVLPARAAARAGG
jgi:signal transduction histidine kinase